MAGRIVSADICHYGRSETFHQESFPNITLIGVQFDKGGLTAMRTTQKSPPMFPLLLRVIGEEATQRLINAFGGINIMIPKGETGRGEKRFSAISGVIGEEAARLLCKHFALNYIYIPKNMAKVRNERNRRIVAAYDQGADVNKLTEEFGLSERQIRNILKQTDMTTVSCQG